MNSEQLVTQARARFDHEVARKVLKEKYQARMLFAWNGGMFRAEPDMITFLSLYGDEEIVALDIYENPVKFRASDVCNLMKARWQEQMNSWLVEHNELNKNR